MPLVESMAFDLPVLAIATGRSRQQHLAAAASSWMTAIPSALLVPPDYCSRNLGCVARSSSASAAPWVNTNDRCSLASCRIICVGSGSTWTLRNRPEFPRGVTAYGRSKAPSTVPTACHLSTGSWRVA